MTNNVEIPSEEVRLQKFLARCGVASRRGCEALIVEGRVCVNGVVSSELGVKVNPLTDEVTVDGALVRQPTHTGTIMLNKPAGYVTTMSDPQGRPCVASLVPANEYSGLFPVGRLDRDTTGLLLFTTDGELGFQLLHPRHHVQKTYLALVQGVPNERGLASLREGVQLEDGLTQPAVVDVLEGADREAALKEFDFGSNNASGTSNAARKMQGKSRNKGKAFTVVRITIREGRKRQVRRMFEYIKCPVIALHRRSMGSLVLADLPRGTWRELSPEEIQSLTREE